MNITLDEYLAAVESAYQPRPADSITARELGERLKIGWNAARKRLEGDVNAGVLKFRDGILDGKRTRFYFPA